MSNKGGKRIGAGRPTVADKANPHTVCVTDKRWIKYQALGGNRWLARKIDEEVIDEPAKLGW